MLVFCPYCFLKKIPSENMYFSLNNFRASVYMKHSFGGEY